MCRRQSLLPLVPDVLRSVEPVFGRVTSETLDKSYTCEQKEVILFGGQACFALIGHSPFPSNYNEKKSYLFQMRRIFERVCYFGFNFTEIKKVETKLPPCILITLVLSFSCSVARQDLRSHVAVSIYTRGNKMKIVNEIKEELVFTLDCTTFSRSLLKWK